MNYKFRFSIKFKYFTIIQKKLNILNENNFYCCIILWTIIQFIFAFRSFFLLRLVGWEFVAIIIQCLLKWVLFLIQNFNFTAKLNNILLLDKFLLLTRWIFYSIRNARKVFKLNNTDCNLYYYQFFEYEYSFSKCFFIRRKYLIIILSFLIEKFHLEIVNINL